MAKTIEKFFRFVTYSIELKSRMAAAGRSNGRV
jgi:hypothetical protein